MRFIDRFDRDVDSMPVCPNGTDISISFYIFNKWYGKEAGQQHLFESYIYEALIAYQQLITRTNIQECGRVRFFVDAKCAEAVLPVFHQAGLDRLIVWIDVPEGIQLSGYIPYLDHEEVAPCRYRFHCDSDFWWVAPRTRRIFDWEAFCNHLDSVPGNNLFGREIYKRNIDYLHYFGQHLDSMEAICERAHVVINKLFKNKPSKVFRSIIETPVETLETETEVSPLKSMAGWFFGVRKGSQALKTLQSCCDLYGNDIVSDEGFIAILLYKYPEIGTYDIFYDSTLKQLNPIYEFCIDNIYKTHECGIINVGCREISHLDDESAKQLMELFQ